MITQSFCCLFSFIQQEKDFLKPNLRLLYCFACFLSLHSLVFCLIVNLTRIIGDFPLLIIVVVLIDSENTWYFLIAVGNFAFSGALGVCVFRDLIF